MKKSTGSNELDLLLEVIDQAFDRHAWHGTNLRGSVRGLSTADASRRPGPGRHTIWEIMLHTAYWKYTVRRRLLGEKRGSFPIGGSNWFERPVRGADWKSEVALLDEVHAGMRKAIAGLDPATLHRKAGTSKYTNAALIYGIASHDLYHAGQIQLVKRLIR